MKENGTSILEMKGICKLFPGAAALDQVDFSVRRGEVHALVGENGAGKSTLMKVLAGVHRQSAGEIFYNGKKVNFAGTLDAKEQGIIIIFQELSLVPELTVAENIFLGDYPVNRYKVIDRKLMNEKARKAIGELGCNFKETDLVEDLSIARQQMVEIARCLVHKASIVILDEPTASLTGHDKDVLFTNIRRLQEQGVAIIYISHKMDEIFDLSDRITVLRDGKKTGTLSTAETNINEVTQLMIGRELDDFYEKAAKKAGKETLRVEGLTKKGQFYDINFTLRRGEVLGFYGLVGAGRSEMAQAIFGTSKPDSGKVLIDGEEKTIKNAQQAVSLGIGLVPESRKEQGLVMGMSCRDNQSLANIRYLNKFGFTQEDKISKSFEEYRQKLDLNCAGPNQPVMNLSGGNQQKVVIGKWLSINPKILILDEPTRGIDVGAKAEIHKLIAKLAEEGMAIIVISSEMPEIMGVSHRIIAMHDGRITGEFTDEEVTETKLINAITNATVCEAHKKEVS